MSGVASQAQEIGHVDVMIVGAGISGIGLAYHLGTTQTGRTLAVVESRDSIGGTWDKFRYPGIRSDSDLHTFGFGFKPWRNENAIADGHEILRYLHETVAEFGLDRYIHFGHRVVGADFSTEQARWTVTLRRSTDGHQYQATCSFLISGAGYYDYDEPHCPEFDGREEFTGRIVHPQHWPDDLDYADKRVVVIGSGATAVTMLPAMAREAAHVTMLQRSPTYVLPLPRRDPIANGLRRILPERLAYRFTRAINVTKSKLIYELSQRYPGQVRRVIRHLNARALPEGYAVDTHFNPKYGPWDQRLCVVPDGDLFRAIASGSASVRTDRIQRFTERSILLASGDELEADIIVTATGFAVIPFGRIALSVDGDAVDLPERMIYKSMMISGIPNFAFVMGYINYSWTLKVDVIGEYLCRLLAYMDRRGFAAVTPVEDPTQVRRPFLEMESGWVKRSMHLYPRQGSHGPWTVDQNYLMDRKTLGRANIEDTALRFDRAHVPVVLGNREVLPQR